MAEREVTGRFCPERLLVGSILWSYEDVDPLRKVEDIVRPADFTDGRCRQAFETLTSLPKSLRGGNRRVAFAQTIRNGLQPGDVSWETWMLGLDLPEAVPALARSHARAVRDASILRAARTACAEAAKQEVNLAVPGQLGDSLAHIEDGIHELTVRSAESYLAAKNPADGIVHEIISRGGKTAIEFGLADLDELISRIEPTDMLVIAARPSVGKTALALQVALNVALHRRPVLVFSLEMGSVALAHRWMANLSDVPLGRIRRGQLIQDDKARLEEAQEALAGMPLDVFEADAPTAEAVRAAVEKARTRRNPALVVVDYLQLLSAPGARDRVSEVSHVSRELKRLARDLGVPVLALSQLSRSARDGERPNLSHLRDSGAIEQDADAVIMLWVNEEPNVMHLAVEKNRNGPTGTCRLRFRPDVQRVESMPFSEEIVL